MNKKPIYWTCGILMAAAFCCGMVDQYLLARQTDYVVTLFTTIDVFAARPIFYGCLALVFGLKIFNPLKQDWLRYTCLGLGLALTLLLAGVALASILDVEFTIVFFGVLRGLFQYTALFLVPGFLLGIGLNRA